MSLIKKPNELKANPTWKGLIYGQVGTWKTTIGASSPNPIFLDFEGGIKRIDPQFRCASVQVNSYNDIKQFINEDLSSYDTIIIDTLGKYLNAVKVWLEKNNPNIRDGRKIFGMAKTEFLNFEANMKALNKNVLYLAHSDEQEKDSGVIKTVVRCEGSVKNIVQENLDFIAFLKKEGAGDKVKIIADFVGGEGSWGKDCLDIGIVEVKPPRTTDNSFIKEVICQKYIDKLKKDDEERVKYEKLTTTLESIIYEIDSVDDINSYFKEQLGSHEPIWGSVTVEKKLLSIRMKELNLTFDKNKKEFVENKKEETKEPETNQTQPKPQTINFEIAKAKLEGEDNEEVKREFWQKNKESIMALPNEQSFILSQLGGQYE